MSQIKSELNIKVTASLEKAVAEELDQQDPTPEKAKAAIQGNDDSTRTAPSN